MLDAISALIDGVCFDTGSMAVASSKTDLINSINSGSNIAPFGSTLLPPKKPLHRLSRHLRRKQLPNDHEIKFYPNFRLQGAGAGSSARNTISHGR
jgi:hypothetical protein